MRLTTPFVLALTFPTLLMSQELPRPEIGIRGGIIRRSSDAFGSTETTTAIMLPDGLFGAGNGLHFLMFLSPRFGLEPQFSLTSLSSNGDSFTLTNIGAQASVFLKPDATRAPYIFMALKLLNQKSSSTGFSDSESANGIGFGIGHRTVYGESVAIRYEGRFLKWSGSAAQDATELALLISVGAVIRRSQTPDR